MTRTTLTLQRTLAAGLVLQLLCAALALVDRWTLGTIDDHVRSAYPSWTSTEVAMERDAIVTYLVAIGALGTLGWLGALWSARSGRGTRTTVTTLFVTGMSALAVTAFASGAAYEQIIPAWLGLTTLGVLTLPALGALMGAWMRRPGPVATAR